MEQREVRDMERNNRYVLLAHGVDVTIMVIYCIVRMTAGRGAYYPVVTILLGIVPIAAEIFFWKKDRESNIIQHIFAIGFAVFYTFILFTSYTNLVYIFTVPMILVATVYNKPLYVFEVSGGAILESVIIVILGACTGGFGYTGADAAVIQIIIMCMVGANAILSAKNSRQNAQTSMERIMSAQKKTEKLFTNISNLSVKTNSAIKSIYDEIEKLNTAAMQTKTAMQELSGGVEDTAQAVQEQTYQTSIIQNKVDSVNDAAYLIADSMQRTLNVLETGNTEVAALAKKVDTSVQNGVEVAEKLETLDKYMKEMNSIVEMIMGITRQTSLLALNASIEAARAGEAGRGFSVVATEISAMATQTKDATEHITQLIQNVSGAISRLVEVIRQMVEGINDERASAENTVRSFENIQANTFEIRESVDKLKDNITELKNVNNVIVDSIQRISAVSEEVAAHATQTMQLEEENTEVLDNISAQMHELIDLTESMR